MAIYVFTPGLCVPTDLGNWDKGVIDHLWASVSLSVRWNNEEYTSVLRDKLEVKYVLVPIS